MTSLNVWFGSWHRCNYNKILTPSVSQQYGQLEGVSHRMTWTPNLNPLNVYSATRSVKSASNKGLGISRISLDRHGSKGILLWGVRALELQSLGLKSAAAFCRLCNTVKPGTEFFSSRQHSDGLMGRCKACAKAIPGIPEKLLSQPVASDSSH